MTAIRIGCRQDAIHLPDGKDRTTWHSLGEASRLKAAQARIRARTRRLILIGSYMEHVTQTDPDRKARLMKGLDGFLERERDRELFDLLQKGSSQ